MRIRPFSGAESSQASRRIVQRGQEPDSLIVVNPTKFKASAESVAAAVAALTRVNMSSFDWAREFSTDATFWSQDAVDSSSNNSATASSSSANSIQCATQAAVYEAFGVRIVANALAGVYSSCLAYGHSGTHQVPACLSVIRSNYK